MIILRKFLGLMLTTLFIAILLTILFVITEGSSLFAIGLFFTGAFPFVLVIGVPVSFLSDYLTKKLNGKLRSMASVLIHSIFGVLAGSVIPFIFENNRLFLIGITFVSSLIFWLVDEILRKRMK